MRRAGRRLATALLLSLLAAGASAPAARADAPPEMIRVSALAGPTWSALTPAQREALSPLASIWNRLDANRKRKWLRIAARYQKLSPAGKARMHARMPQLVGLTREQRITARKNLERAYSLSAERRRALTRSFQHLSDARKRQLAEWSRKRRKMPPPRPGTARHPGFKPAPDEVDATHGTW